MQISKTTTQLLVIGALCALGVYLLIPKAKKKAKVTNTVTDAPAEAPKESVDKRNNARIVLDAYLNAKEDGQKPKALEKLNNIFAEEYGLRVYKNKEGNYVARSLSGEDILMVRNAA